MFHSFEATEVSFVEEDFDGDKVLIGGFGRELGTDNAKYLMLQRSIDDDEEGWGAYVEWCDQGNSCYDCIKSFNLAPNQAEIVFDESANFLLERNKEGEPVKLTELLITFSLSDEEFIRLRQQLQDIIFKGRDCFASHSESIREEAKR